MSQNKTTTKKTSSPTNSTKTKGNRTTSPAAAIKRAAEKSAVTESSALEAMPAEAVASDVHAADEATENVTLAKNEETADAETDVVSQGTEVMRRRAPYENDDYLGEVVGFIDFAAEEDGLQADDATEPSTSGEAEVGSPPAEEAEDAGAVHIQVNEPQRTSEDEVEHPSENPLVTEDVNPQTASETQSTVGAEKPAEKVKGLDRQLRATSPRYAAACAEVGRLRKGFLYALNRKAAILGVERVGEAVPVKNADIDAIDAEIREARQKLEDLVARKKQLKGASPELDEVNQTIRELSRQRNSARIEKKAARAAAI